MTGEEVQRYDYTLGLAKSYGLAVEVSSDGFRVTRIKGTKNYGSVPTTEMLYHFVCGYGWGINSFDDPANEEKKLKVK